MILAGSMRQASGASRSTPLHGTRVHLISAIVAFLTEQHEAAVVYFNADQAVQTKRNDKTCLRTESETDMQQVALAIDEWDILFASNSTSTEGELDNQDFEYFDVEDYDIMMKSTLMNTLMKRIHQIKTWFYVHQSKTCFYDEKRVTFFMFEFGLYFMSTNTFDYCTI